MTAGTVERSRGGEVAVSEESTAQSASVSSRPELDFATAPIAAIASAFFRHGCVLLRNFADARLLAHVQKLIAGLHQEIWGVHVAPRDLYQYNLLDFHHYLFGAKHFELLNTVFSGEHYYVSDATSSRRVSRVGEHLEASQWQSPLPPHIDACFHPLQFTVNLWTPFVACGLDAPALGVVCVSIPEVMEYSGFRPARHEGERADNFADFDPMMYEMWMKDAARIERFYTAFGDRVWRPQYDPGDVMMMSNWTLHFTHATPRMRGRRGNVEMRFIAPEISPADLRQRQQRAARAAA